MIIMGERKHGRICCTLNSDRYTSMDGKELIIMHSLQSDKQKVIALLFTILLISFTSCDPVSAIDDWPGGEWHNEENTIFLDMDTRLGTVEKDGMIRRIAFVKNRSWHGCLLDYIRDAESDDNDYFLVGTYELIDDKLVFQDMYDDHTLTLIRRTEEEGAVPAASEPPQGVWICDSPQISIDFKTGQGSMTLNNSTIAIKLIKDSSVKIYSIVHFPTDSTENPVGIINGTYVVKGGLLYFTDFYGDPVYVFRPQETVV